MYPPKFHQNVCIRISKYSIKLIVVCNDNSKRLRNSGKRKICPFSFSWTSSESLRFLSNNVTWDISLVNSPEILTKKFPSLGLAICKGKGSREEDSVSSDLQEIIQVYFRTSFSTSALIWVQIKWDTKQENWNSDIEWQAQTVGMEIRVLHNQT